MQSPSSVSSSGYLRGLKERQGVPSWLPTQHSCCNTVLFDDAEAQRVPTHQLRVRRRVQLLWQRFVAALHSSCQSYAQA